MLSLFPELLTYGLVAPLLIRLALGLTVILTGYQERSKNWLLAGLLFLSGLFLIVGFFTQAVAIFLSLVLFASTLQREHLLPLPILSQWLMLAMSLSLLLSGAGFLAIDWPL